ncbi:MAG: type IX secretion system membrane protein PorP/SprF, partial [Flavobacteriales bacterium]
FTFGKNNFDNKSYAGMGLHFNRDVGGDSRFGSNNIGASLSGHLVTSRRSKFSAGIQTSVSSRSGDLSNVLFYSQWNGSTFDPSIPTNEPNQIARFSYIDAGAGISYTFSTKGTRVAQTQQRYFNVGLFAQHVSRPKLRYNEITYDRLNVKVGGHLESEFNIGYGLALEFKTLQMLQGKHYIGRYGMLLKAILKQSASITRLKNDAFCSAGLYMSSTGTLSPVFVIDLGGFQLGINYDLELAKISRAYRSSIEFSLSYSFTKSSLFKRSKIG